MGGCEGVLCPGLSPGSQFPVWEPEENRVQGAAGAGLKEPYLPVFLRVPGTPVLRIQILNVGPPNSDSVTQGGGAGDEQESASLTLTLIMLMQGNHNPH